MNKLKGKVEKSKPSRGLVQNAPLMKYVLTPVIQGIGESKDEWELRLYVVGQNQSAIVAFDNLRKICEEHLQGRYRIEVVDLVEKPQLSRDDQILAVPTLVRCLPQPLRKIIGDLSDTERVLVGLQLRPKK